MTPGLQAQTGRVAVRLPSRGWTYREVMVLGAGSCCRCDLYFRKRVHLHSFFDIVESFKFSSSPGILAHDPGNGIFADGIKGSQHKILSDFRCVFNPMTGVLLTLGAGTESHSERARGVCRAETGKVTGAPKMLEPSASQKHKGPCQCSE